MLIGPLSLALNKSVTLKEVWYFMNISDSNKKSVYSLHFHVDESSYLSIIRFSPDWGPRDGDNEPCQQEQMVLLSPQLCSPHRELL